LLGLFDLFGLVSLWVGLVAPLYTTCILRGVFLLFSIKFITY
jgi:hypothetical protein